MTTSMPSEPLIVVGVDGSAASVAALREGAKLVDMMNGRLTAVTCWSVPQFYAESIDFDNGPFEHDAQLQQEAAIVQAFGSCATRPCDSELRRGRPATELVAASRDASLLIVGTRGHGEFVQLLLGSVSLECITHAHCPVLTVRRPAVDSAKR